MMFVLGFFVGLGAASLIALIVAALVSCDSLVEDEGRPESLLDLCAHEAGR